MHKLKIALPQVYYWKKKIDIHNLHGLSPSAQEELEE